VIRRCIADADICTDVIAGFPGESEEVHRQTVEFIGRLPFTYLHVFPYSDRSGTAASDMAEKVDSRTIKRRSGELRQISEDKNRAFRRRFLGRSLSVLTLSEKKDGMRTALSGNYLKAKVDPSMPSNQLVQARVVAEDLEGYQVLQPV
jgi:threonylcarbamoyladenosine tRNA methylthiotransferase MtaB